MKKTIVRAAKRVTSSVLAEQLEQFNQLCNDVQNLKDLTASFNQKIGNYDFRIGKLKALAREVEPYQPTYGVANIFSEEPRRSSLDRCRAIEQYLGNVAGQRILDIGSSIGYICYYFADRGAVCEGWENNPKNAEVSRLVGEINGISVDFKTKTLDMETVKTIKPGDFDVITILSVFHHTTHYNGLKYTQKIIEELLKRVPVMIVELAKKGEDPSLFWDKSQPKDEKDIFNLVSNKVTIEKIGEFSNHLSKKSRPMYAIRVKDNTIVVNNKTYQYSHKRSEAYKGSPVVYSNLRRSYYISPDYVIKEYIFGKKDNNENLRQIVSEIDTLIHLEKVHNMPELVDFELSNRSAKVVLTRIKGELLIDLIESKKKVNSLIVAKDLIKTLADLEGEGLHHNDVRSWNVIFDGETAFLIDYGFVSHKDSDNDVNSLLWIIAAVLSGEREDYSIAKLNPPSKKIFQSNKAMLELYKAIVGGEKSPKKLINIVSGKAAKQSFK